MYAKVAGNILFRPLLTTAVLQRLAETRRKINEIQLSYTLIQPSSLAESSVGSGELPPCTRKDESDSPRDLDDSV